MTYNWQQENWPNFEYDASALETKLLQYATNLGQIDGQITHLKPEEQQNIALEFMTSEAIKTSEIEGEYLSRIDVMSSIKRQLGLQIDQRISHDARALGVAALINNYRKNFAEPLSETMLFEWHNLLLGYAKLTSNLTVGAWRKHKEPMQIISGRPGKITVYYEAPPSNKVPRKMQQFIIWYNRVNIAAPIHAGLAHLYYESIHPFEDGNGRIGRALSEKALAQSFEKTLPISISTTIERNRKAYYKALNEAQTKNKVTEWLIYFIDTLLEAQNQAKTIIEFTIQKTLFLDTHKSQLNERQLKALFRMFEAGPEGFEGGMTAKKYIAITHCSKATATRDLTNLKSNKILKTQDSQGRNTHYVLNLPPK